ncbi:thiol peroxidase [Flavobacterium agricola]|uniref:Thiol peroxidase n=1 Tax=Flavobacterium agricola TaxID=2870839 RepID=A0ABY6M114_9FLAO|nr:thiol peroxidase [Flavobacterium agricola]UYW02240.1 thiol peroxidase [Flavobacterium agricola]
MATITLKGNALETVGNLPAVNTQAPKFELVATDLSTKTLQDFAGKNVVLNIFPSVDTAVCAMSVREFNKKASTLPNTVVLCISKDLPFALARFCGAEGLDQVVSLSDFRSDFGKTYGVTMQTGPLAGLLSRSIVVINPKGEVVYTEQVPEITQEPNYEKAIENIK